MYNSNIPTRVELPSTRQLVRSTIIAAAVACLLLVTTILPAEYGVDPTGIGNMLGLTKMGEIKTSLAKEAAAPTPTPATATTPTPKTALTSMIEQTGKIAVPMKGRTDEMTITLKPNQAAEVKLTMAKNMSAIFEWKASEPLNFDAHGDPIPYQKGFYHGYGKGRSVDGDKGTLTAAFDGKHGWFWRNRSGKTVTLTLQTRGMYETIKRVM